MITPEFEETGDIDFSHTPKTIGHARQPVTVPAYKAIQFYAGVLQILAFLCYAAGILLLFVGVAVIASTNTTEAKVQGFSALGISLSAGVSGIGFHVACQLLYAFRDMAMNTFKIRQSLAK